VKILKKLYKKLLYRSRGVQLLHALLFSAGFRREIWSVLSGIRAHRASEKSLSGVVYRLRRNIHRLEKGLIMDPRRDVFALDYIEETVEAYIQVRASACSDSSQMKWFEDVLQEYFSVTGSHAIIVACGERFDGAIESEQGDKKSVPMPRSSYLKSEISYDEFYALCRQRRSVRWYQDQKVPRELIDQAIAAAAQSPSACNRQPFEFRVFDDPAKVQEIAGIPMGTVGFTHQFPVIIVLVGKLNAYEFDRDRHLIYIDGSLAAMTFMFTLETLGLSSCPINWAGVEKTEVQMDAALRLEAYERPVMLISVGYAKQSGKIPFSHKKELGEIRRYN
tara:strand:- start:216 stop:1217 length:1002 start_codon:yes stop_codon:yes gene_type:complete